MSQQAELQARVRASNRALYGVSTYGWLLGCAFLLVAFNDFPQHKWSIGLGWLAVLTALRGICEQLRGVQMVDNMLSDAGERKTRHTVTLAAEWTQEGRSLDIHDLGDFWFAVERRVEAEVGETQPTRWWAQLGLTIWNITSRALGDIIGLIVAFLLTSSSY